MTTRRSRSAWDFQEELWTLARSYVERTGAEAVGGEEEVATILGQWREMLDGVRDDRDAVADRVDWVAKLRVVEGYQRAPRPRRRTTRSCAPSICSITICGPRTPWLSASDCESSARSGEVREAVHNPPAEYAGLFSRSVRGPIPRADRRRQLGFSGVRSRRRAVAASANARPFKGYTCTDRRVARNKCDGK